MEFLYHWGLFAAEAFTLVIAILAVFFGILAISSSAKQQPKGKLIIKPLNECYQSIVNEIYNGTLDKKALQSHKKLLKKSKKEAEKTESNKPRLFVIDFIGDIKASAVSSLRECITAILLTAQKNDEVLLRLESPGGAVHCYGLAASQLARLRTANIHLTIAVDQVAASGGYMMACLANQIIAAPFAIIGSIGVVFQLPNFNRLLHKNNVEFEQVTAGEYKRTLSMFGENTKQDRAKVQQDVDETQVLFKQHIQTYRPNLDISQVATGEHWYGQQALKFDLIDQLGTSDDFLLQAIDKFALYQLTYEQKKPLGKKLTEGLSKISAKWLEFKNYARS
jgi:serine protease SohB